ncbi:hypothetical protein GmRootV213_06170 [Variovorax sp. V213]|uniref:hypothetical protein n=1 Tax=Variovorax sp. V213 TaxID=3065955 RepID=UPI0034E84F04
MTLDGVLLRPDEYEQRSLDEPWRWHVPSDFTLMHVTVLGHMLFSDHGARIWFLDSWSGHLYRISDNEDEFSRQVTGDAEFFSALFFDELLGSLSAAGLERRAGEVFAPFVSPALGGSLGANNFSLAPVRAYASSSSAEVRAIAFGNSGA